METLEEITRWERTQILEDRLLLNNRNTLNFGGRHIIKRDTPINQGVYLGGFKREAIVVEFENSKILQDLYQKAKKKASIKGIVQKNHLLHAVYQVIKEALPIQDDDALDQLLTKKDLNNDKKVHLEIFLDKGIGVCRHDALACAALLEQFIKEGHLTGKVSVDRNRFRQGVHAWCRYTTSNGAVYILDVRQDYIGSLITNDKGKNWPYARPEDL